MNNKKTVTTILLSLIFTLSGCSCRFPFLPSSDSNDSNSSGMSTSQTEIPDGPTVKAEITSINITRAVLFVEFTGDENATHYRLSVTEGTGEEMMAVLDIDDYTSGDPIDLNETGYWVHISNPTKINATIIPVASEDFYPLTDTASIDFYDNEFSGTLFYNSEESTLKYEFSTNWPVEKYQFEIINETAGRMFMHITTTTSGTIDVSGWDDELYQISVEYYEPLLEGLYEEYNMYRQMINGGRFPKINIEAPKPVTPEDYEIDNYYYVDNETKYPRMDVIGQPNSRTIGLRWWESSAIANPPWSTLYVVSVSSSQIVFEGELVKETQDGTFSEEVTLVHDLENDLMILEGVTYIPYVYVSSYHIKEGWTISATTTQIMTESEPNVWVELNETRGFDATALGDNKFTILMNGNTYTYQQAKQLDEFYFCEYRSFDPLQRAEQTVYAYDTGIEEYLFYQQHTYDPEINTYNCCQVYFDIMTITYNGEQVDVYTRYTKIYQRLETGYRYGYEIAFVTNRDNLPEHLVFIESQSEIIITTT
jgi:hypothetical protein